VLLPCARCRACWQAASGEYMLSTAVQASPECCVSNLMLKADKHGSILSTAAFMEVLEDNGDMQARLFFLRRRVCRLFVCVWVWVWVRVCGCVWVCVGVCGCVCVCGWVGGELRSLVAVCGTVPGRLCVQLGVVW
jgi:hypothetical protein